MTPDEQRVADEIERCKAIAADRYGMYDGDGIASMHAYYTARAYLLEQATTEEVIRFLREETLDALAGRQFDQAAATPRTDRWLRLQELDYLGHRQRRLMVRRMRSIQMNTAGLAAIDE